jgi:hypothetical protein
VPAAPSITTSTLPQAAVGTQFSESLTVSGGVSPYTWTVSSGTLPSCLTLTPAGVLSGTPTAACAGTYNVTFKVTDSGAPTPLTATEALTITINGAPAIVLPAPASLPAGVFNTAYTGSVGATGGAGALTYTLTGSLPTGLTLNASSGAITGTPTATGTFTFTIQAADAFGDSASQAYSITVTYPTLSITTTSLAAGLYNTTYSPVTLAATGGSESSANLTWTWAAASGSSLPAGLSLSTAGVISGKPTAAGSFSVVITVADSVSKTNASVTLPIAITYPTLSITTSSLPNGVLNAAYPSTTLAATGGSGSSANDSWTWAAASGSSLPAGLNLSTAGVISGTPTAGGSFSVVVTVADSVSKTNATATLPITITYPTLTISTASLPNGTLNATYAPVTLTATGGSDSTANYSWTWAAASGSSLPAGLNLSTAGVISGTPTAGGSFSVIITVADSVSKTNATATLPITITYPTLTITTGSLPNGILNTAYSPVTLAATGGSDSTANYSWTWAAAASSSLPPGMSLSTAGVLSGTPTSGGSYSVVITVADSVSKTSAQATLPFNIGFTTLVISTNSLPAGLYNTTYGPVTLAGTGGSGNSANYTWTWAAAPTSSLPAGLSLSSAGVISGKPTATGSFSVVVTLADSVSKTNTTATLSISVTYAALSITTASPLPSGVINATYTPVTLAATGGSGSSANYSWTWAAASGSSLPAGLSLSPAGVISGKPTAAGTSSVVVTVADSVSSTSAQATLSIVINASLAITTTTLPSATTGAAYSQQLASSGGSGGNTWSTTGTSNLSTFNLTLSAAGLIQGTPTATGTASFTAQVKDSNGDVATEPLTIAVYGPLALSPSTLPGGTTGLSYNQTITATGGSGSYSLTVTGLSDGLSDSISGANVNIGGTPTSATTVSFTVTVKDTVTSATVGPISYSIAVTNPAALSLPAPNPSSLPSATVNAFYNGSVNANGGAGTYTWTVNGNVLSGGTTTSLGNGNLGVAANGNSLTITGTPNTLTTTGSPISFTASVADNAGQSTGTNTYTIVVSNLATISGQIILNNYCGSSGNMPGITVSINTSPVQTTTTDSNGNYAFSNIPNGSYTVTPSITGPESVFYPATNGVTVNGNPITGENFGAALGYTVTGNITYGGAKTGQVYVTLNNSSCGSSNGTSISKTALTSGGAYSIRGVGPGTYTLQAWMDTTGQGSQNTSDPSGSASSNVSVSTANVTGASVTMTDPTVAAPTTGPGLQNISPANLGVGISFKSITNSNGVEAVTSYTVEWSTSSSFTSPSSATFAAIGTNSNVWILNNSTAGINGSFVDGTPYYFRARGNVTAGSGPFTTWGGTTPTAVTIGAPSSTGYFTVSGTVTLPSSVTPTGPLYVGLYNQNNGSIYATHIASPSNSSPNAYTVSVLGDSNPDYFLFAILDQNNDGLIDVGDISNTNSSNSNGLAVTGNLAGQDQTLPTANSTVSVTTGYSQQTNQNGTYTQYSLNFDVREGNELPVSATLMTGPNVIQPIDMGSNCQNCGTPQWQYYVTISPDVPTVGQAYTFLVTYSGGTQETLTGTITGVLGASALPTLISPTGTGVGDTPSFDWTYPASASSYTYQFSLCCGNNGDIWDIPGNNSNSNDFSSSQITPPLVWGVDPTNSGNAPSPSSLSAGTYYSWSLQAQDSNGNSAQAQMNFETVTAAVSLPAASSNPLSSGVVGVPYSGTINASGGAGNQNYYFTVNGATIPTNMDYVTVPNSDGLTFANNGFNGLFVGGTPTTAESVSLQVEVFDTTNSSDTATVTYTVVINNETPVSLPAASSNPLGSALVSLPYSGNINASGGPGGGDYAWTVNGTAVPTNNTPVTIPSSEGLTATNSGGDTLNFGGTPPTVNSGISLTVTVTDTTNSSDTATVTYTLPVVAGPNGANNKYLSGTYVCKFDGFFDGDGSRWTALASFQANGSAGTFTNGVWDQNSRDLTTEMSGTMTGTYSIGADNNGLLTMSSTVTSGGSGTHPSQFAIALNNTNPLTTATEFRMVETDDVGATPSGQHGTGDCYLANTSVFGTDVFTGNSFVFEMNGENGSGTPQATLGRFYNASGTAAGSLTGGIADEAKVTDSSVTTTTLTGGSYTTPGPTNGRSTLTFTTSNGSVSFEVYTIDANRMFFIQTTDAKAQSGDVRKQQQATYSGAELSGPFVDYSQAYEYSNSSVSGYDSEVYQGTGSGSGTLTINQSYHDKNGTYKIGDAVGGPITVTFDSSNPGRATLSPGGNVLVYLYLFNNNSAFLLDFDNGGGYLETGWVEPQSQTTFTYAAVAGTYLFGQLPRPEPTSNGNAGEFILSSCTSGSASCGLTGSITTAGAGNFTYDQSFGSMTYNWDTTVTGTGSFLFGSGNKGGSCIVISAMRAACIGNADSGPSVMILQQ